MRTWRHYHHIIVIMIIVNHCYCNHMADGGFKCREFSKTRQQVVRSINLELIVSNVKCLLCSRILVVPRSGLLWIRSTP